MAEVQIVYWRDIPAMVTVRDGRQARTSANLSERFQIAIDEAAMRAGLTGDDVYLEQWRRGPWTETDGEVAEVARRVAEELEASYGPELLHTLILAKGIAASGSNA
jgi:hypothetical protein